MTISDVSVGGKVTAATQNEIIAAVNAVGATTMTPLQSNVKGVVTVTASTTVVLNDVFTSEFVNYLVVADLTMASAAVPLVTLRSGSTTAVTAYDKQRLLVSNATASASQSLDQTSWDMGVAAFAGRNLLRIFLAGPALAAATVGSARNDATPNPMTTAAGFQDATLQHRTATAYDAIRIAASTGNMTGTVVVFGLR